MGAVRNTIAGIPVAQVMTVWEPIALPGYVRPNVCNMIRASRFED
jgi:hypothetical protein